MLDPMQAAMVASLSSPVEGRLLAVVSCVDHDKAQATLSAPSGEWALSRAEAESIWPGLRPGCLIGFEEASPGVAACARLLV